MGIPQCQHPMTSLPCLFIPSFCQAQSQLCSGECRGGALRWHGLQGSTVEESCLLWRSPGGWGQLKGEEGSPRNPTGQAQAPWPSGWAAHTHSGTSPCKLQTGHPHGGPRGPHPAVASGPWTTTPSPVALGLSVPCILKVILPLHCAATAPQPGNGLRLKRPAGSQRGACRAI